MVCMEVCVLNFENGKRGGGGVFKDWCDFLKNLI